MIITTLLLSLTVSSPARAGLPQLGRFCDWMLGRAGEPPPILVPIELGRQGFETLSVLSEFGTGANAVLDRLLIEYLNEMKAKLGEADQALFYSVITHATRNRVYPYGSYRREEMSLSIRIDPDFAESPGGRLLLLRQARHLFDDLRLGRKGPFELSTVSHEEFERYAYEEEYELIQRGLKNEEFRAQFRDEIETPLHESAPYGFRERADWMFRTALRGGVTLTRRQYASAKVPTGFKRFD